MILSPNIPEEYFRSLIRSPDRSRQNLRNYADWLEQRGDLRGEYLRIQLELELKKWDDPEVGEMKQRQLALLREHRFEWRNWLLYIFEIDGQYRDNTQYKVENIDKRFSWHMHASEFIAKGMPPHIFSVTLHGLEDLPDKGATLHECPHLAGLAMLEIDVQGEMLGDELRLGDSPHLSELSLLAIGGCDKSQTTLSNIFSSKAFPHMRELYLGGMPTEAWVWEHPGIRVNKLQFFQGMKELRKLDISNLGVSAQTIDNLCKCLPRSLETFGITYSSAAQRPTYQSLVNIAAALPETVIHARQGHMKNPRIAAKLGYEFDCEMMIALEKPEYRAGFLTSIGRAI